MPTYAWVTIGCIWFGVTFIVYACCRVEFYRAQTALLELREERNAAFEAARKGVAS